MLSERTVEVLIIGKADLSADLLHWDPLENEGLAFGQAALKDELVKAFLKLFLTEVADGAGTDEKMFGNILQRQLPGVILIDIFDQLIHQVFFAVEFLLWGGVLHSLLHTGKDLKDQ